jgi:hypothetical protein
MRFCWAGGAAARVPKVGREGGWGWGRESVYQLGRGPCQTCAAGMYGAG